MQDTREDVFVKEIADRAEIIRDMAIDALEHTLSYAEDGVVVNTAAKSLQVRHKVVSGISHFDSNTRCVVCRCSLQSRMRWPHILFVSWATGRLPRRISSAQLPWRCGAPPITIRVNTLASLAFSTETLSRLTGLHLTGSISLANAT